MLSLIAINIWKTLDSEFGSYDLFLSGNIKINEGQEQAYRRYFSCIRMSCIMYRGSAMVYRNTLSLRRMMERLVNTELEWIWNEAVMAPFSTSTEFAWSN